jgi:hypothetical protein
MNINFPASFLSLSVFSLGVLPDPPIDELMIPMEPLIIFLATTVILVITTRQFLAKKNSKVTKSQTRIKPSSFLLQTHLS